MSAPNYWDDQQKAQQTINEMNHTKGLVESFETITEELADAFVLYELVIEEDDHDLLVVLKESATTLQPRVNEFELQMLLSEPYDSKNAILELHPGAGVTD